MLQRITAYLLIVSLVTVNFTRLFVYAGFELNRNYIATKLCENRSKPWMHCNGKCYFMKKIKQAEDNKAAGERSSQKNLFQEAGFNEPEQIKFHSVLLAVIASPEPPISLPTQIRPIFQPPQLS